MLRHLPTQMRDETITAFRYRICDKCEIVPFRHQAEWWAASDGLILTDIPDPNGMEVRTPTPEDDNATERFTLLHRPKGRARVLADLGAFKTGKSFGAGVWAASFAAIPNAKVELVGLIYSICSPEFEYIAEMLLSERGLNLKAEKYVNSVKQGNMSILLENGASFECKSWDNKEALKGKEIDAYIYCEAYQLPGIECYTDFSQNLDARSGYAIFATTPDRPWLKQLHDAAHSGVDEFADWHCTCGVPRSQNIFTHNPIAMERDKDLMPADKYQIHYLGKLGDFVGQVYSFQQGDRLFSHLTHPELFQPDTTESTFENLRLPDGWEIVGGADTGTYTSAVVVAFSPEGDAFVLWEAPNYRYIGGKAERLKDITIPTWAADLRHHSLLLGGRGDFWADRNSQFKSELLAYNVHLMSNKQHFETRTSIAQEYFTQNRIFFAPWLKILPFETENAKWPDDHTASGRFARVKDRDHTLDGLEHVLSRRPQGIRVIEVKEKGTWIEQWVGKRFKSHERGNVHLGEH